MSHSAPRCALQARSMTPPFKARWRWQQWTTRIRIVTYDNEAVILHCPRYTYTFK
jgi:hypothetical protein